MTQAAIPLGTVKTTPTQDQSPAQLYLVGQEDFVIPLVFPDYLIQVVDETEVNVFGRKILIPAQKLPQLGHAGVLVINGKTGLTKYYEYGRYPGPGPAGRTRPGQIPDVVLKGGMIVESSLKKTLRVISSNHGHNGRISGVVLRGNVFDQALTWLKEKEAENNDPKRKEYDFGNHNCMTFVADLAEHVGLDSPLRMRIVMPKAYMVQYQLSEVDIEYDFSNDLLEITE